MSDYSQKKEPKIMLPKQYMIFTETLIEAFETLLKYGDLKDDEERCNACQIIDDGVLVLKYLKSMNKAKTASQEKRQAYQNYINEQDKIKRNQLRKNYLDIAQVHENWRSGEEVKL